MNATVTEKDLQDVQWSDFSLQVLANGKQGLILICHEEKGARKLLELLKSNAFDLKVFQDEKNGNYSFVLEFIDSEITMKFNTERSEKNYPPLSKLKTGEVKYITTGVWIGRTAEGRQCVYDPNAMRLGKPDIAESFKLASGVQFVAGRTENEPGLVVLTYENFDHIQDADADEAYNRLLDIAKGRPLLEIERANDKEVNLRIWDILIDLDIRITGLKYSPQELEKFLFRSDPEHTFAFALGYRPKNGESAAIAATKHEGFEFVTLYGYKLKHESTGKYDKIDE
jgi:hypothetical protein